MSDETPSLRLHIESAFALAERTIKRLFVLLIALIVAWGLTIGGFIWYLNQLDYESYDMRQDGEGVNIMGDGNGVSFDGSQHQESEP